MTDDLECTRIQQECLTLLNVYRENIKHQQPLPEIFHFLQESVRKVQRHARYKRVDRKVQEIWSNYYTFRIKEAFHVLREIYAYIYQKKDFLELLSFRCKLRLSQIEFINTVGKENTKERASLMRVMFDLGQKMLEQHMNTPAIQKLLKENKLDPEKTVRHILEYQASIKDNSTAK